MFAGAAGAKRAARLHQNPVVTEGSVEHDDGARHGHGSPCDASVLLLTDFGRRSSARNTDWLATFAVFKVVAFH